MIATKAQRREGDYIEHECKFLLYFVPSINRVNEFIMETASFYLLLLFFTVFFGTGFGSTSGVNPAISSALTKV